jgi:hypothetical protein
MRALLMAAALAVTSPLAAAQVYSTGYDMKNGDGQASGGSFNYWDKAYSGTGSTTTDGAALSGGSGDLTDGVVAGDYWFNVENGAGTGPYVGWRGDVDVKDPLVTFHFAGSPTLTGIRVHVDNSLAGGVGQPRGYLVDGTLVSATTLAAGTIGWVDLSGFSVTGGTHTLQFLTDNSGFYPWVFVSEVTFDGTTGGVPEASVWAMLLAGFGLTGAAVRRRRISAAA